MENTKISRKLLSRLPVYLDYLRSLPEDSGNISATAIAKALGLGDVQVRKDLSKVAHEGRCRTGRSREQLIRDIEEYLSFAATTGTIVVGVGKLGQALLDYSGFEEAGLNVMAGFDLHPTQKNSRTGKPSIPCTGWSLSASAMMCASASSPSPRKMPSPSATVSSPVGCRPSGISPRCG